MGELEWFDAYCKLDNAPGAAEETLELIRKAEADATRKGVVGIRDYEMAENVDTWTRRFSAASPRPRDANDSAWTGIDWDGSFTHGIRGLRVEAGVYPERLEDAIEAGWKTGVELPGSDGLGHVGTMKMISDGSLNTRSAFCSMPYSDIFPDFYGTLSYAPDQIETYFHVATCHGFAIACHAIGDEANTIVPNAAASTHAHGSIEHAQMLKPADIPRFAKLGLTASHSTPWTIAMSSHGSGRIRVEPLTHSRHCMMPASGCAWGRMRRLRRSTRGWRYRPLCSARKAQTANRSSRSNAWMRAPRWRLPQPSAATALNPEIQPTWCSWTATRMLSPRRRRCGRCRWRRPCSQAVGRTPLCTVNDSRQGTHEDSSHESHREPSAAQARRQTSYRHDLSVITRAITKPIGRQIITMNARNAQSSACSVSNCPR